MGVISGCLLVRGDFVVDVAVLEQFRSPMSRGLSVKDVHISEGKNTNMI